MSKAAKKSKAKVSSEPEVEAPAVPPGKYYWMGNHAIAEAALYAGCRFFGGYPITPSSEIAEHMARRLPELDGVFVQMEDEIGSIASLIGASLGGVKSMTATSGPGYSLMQENIGLAAMTETPLVIVNAMRGGPSTGQPTNTMQGDVLQSRFGSHGDYELIVFAPADVQECFDLTIEAFNMSEKYRSPAVLLTEEITSHLRERVIVPEPGERQIINRPRPDPNMDPADYKPYEVPEGSLVPPMADLGSKYHHFVTGLTHDERGYPDMSPETQEKLVTRLVKKIKEHDGDLNSWEEIGLDDAEIVVVSFGISGRGARGVVNQLRKEGKKVGLLRLKILWPFPEAKLRELAEKVSKFLVIELNMGQVLREVQRTAGYEKTFGLNRPNGIPFSPEEMTNKINELLEA